MLRRHGEIVAEGTQFPQGTVLLRFPGDTPTVEMFPDLNEAKAAHAGTQLEWLDDDTEE